MTNNEIIDQARDKLAQFYEKQSMAFARDLEKIIGQGVFDVNTIKERLTALGWDREVVKAMGEFDALFKLSQQQFKKLGVSFLWTGANEQLMGEFIQAKAKHLALAFKEEFANSMVDYAFKAKLSGKTQREIIQEASERLATEGRRIATEVDTALASFDRASKSMLYQNAGIERFVYVGPPASDPHIRDSCKAVMSDTEKQTKTGWTREDIANSPVDMVTGGGYNCRHDWLPFEPETEKIVKEIV